MTWTGRFESLFIDGEWVSSTGIESLQVVSPTTEHVIARVPSGTTDDIDAAVRAAQRAFRFGAWRHTRLPDRIDVLRRFLGTMRDRREELAALITAEMGSPITQSRTAHVDVAVAIGESYLETAASYPFETVRRSPSGNAVVLREPIGVVAAIVPWNVPLGVTFHKLFPALLSGCTLIVKPAPEAPLFAYWLAEALSAAGLPLGVLNLVPADRDVSEYLVTHPGVDKVGFTGSTAAGRRIAGLCGNDLRRVTLELGGKSAAIILEDADLDATVETLRMGSFRNSGQVCTLKTRVLVSRHQEQEVLERLESLVASMPVGDPTDDATQIGPMVSQRHRERVEGYIEIGRTEGAKCVVGGGRPARPVRGWFVEPTVFSGVTPRMTIAQEEIFGPVLAVLTYEDEDDAVSIANDSRYGLSGAVFSADVDHALTVARRIESGTVDINGMFTGWGAPFGGVKDSGIGREAGPEGFDAYLTTKSISLPPDHRLVVRESRTA